MNEEELYWKLTLFWLVGDEQNWGPNSWLFVPPLYSDGINRAPQVEEFQMVIITVNFWLFQRQDRIRS